jgi:hypothetical protein
MPKLKLLFIFAISTLIVSAQENSKPKTNFKHILGLDVGYGSYGSDLVGYKGEINLNYIFNLKKCFFAKVQIGIAPTKNFGIITKGFASIGITTNLNKPISWHLSIGNGYASGSKSYNKPINNEFVNYTMHAGPIFIETGFYIKPMKLKNQYLGINFSMATLNINGTDRNYVLGWAAFINVSYNIQLNKPRNTQ